MSSQVELNHQALAVAQSLCPLVRSQAASVENERSLTGTVIDAFRRAQLFWITVPKDLGGGSYQFGSGIAHADWIAGGVFVREHGRVQAARCLFFDAVRAARTAISG